jgi:ATP-binding cassette subfamily C protein LapB
MLTGHITFGEITFCALIGGRAFSPIQNLVRFFMKRSDIKLLRYRIDGIAYRQDQYNIDVPMFPDDIEGTIEFLNISIKNQMNHQCNFNFKINAKSFICINLSIEVPYKNIFKQIIRQEDIDSGKILIDSLDITKWNMDSLKGKIEYVSDEVNLFKGSIIDNITYFNSAKNRDVYDAAALTGFDKLVSQMAEGFETLLEIQSKNYLSAAFMQRLNLTRALLNRPRILLIDRIDESMDFETLENFLWLLKKFKGKITIIIATDNEKIKAMADSVLFQGGIDNE